jgi:hypothetical protein
MATKSNRSDCPVKPKNAETGFPAVAMPADAGQNKFVAGSNILTRWRTTPGEKALEKWLERRDDLLVDRTPRTPGDGLAETATCATAS